MSDLDGVWDVRRVSGVLPPLLGVRKRIAGGRGETRVRGLPGVPFRVDGLTLRYVAPLEGFVDELEPDGDRYRGRATFRGREYGRFVLVRVRQTAETDASEGGGMTGEAGTTIKDQLVKYIDEAIAMEQNVLRMLDSMIGSTDDEEMRTQLRDHKVETERQVDRLRGRLEAHGATPSVVKEAGGIVGALMKSVVDMARGDKPGRNARDGFATEHMEIASYELLERVARRAGDEETAEVARQNRGEEEAMAARIASNWDKVAELSLREAGITV